MTLATLSNTPTISFLNKTQQVKILTRTSSVLLHPEGFPIVMFLYQQFAPSTSSLSYYYYSIFYFSLLATIIFTCCRFPFIHTHTHNIPAFTWFIYYHYNKRKSFSLSRSLFFLRLQIRGGWGLYGGVTCKMFLWLRRISRQAMLPTFE